MRPEYIISSKPIVVRNGIIVLSGYGISVSVEHGLLSLADGIGRERRHGAFTRCLLEGLGGVRSTGFSRIGVTIPPKGGATSAGVVVTLDEIVPYVKDAVEALTSGGQTPTAAPDEIIPFTTIPLARRR